MRLLAALLLLTALSGCADQGPLLPPQVHSDQFSNSIEIVGSSRLINPFGGTSRIWLIRSWVDKRTHAVADQLYVDIHYIGDWKHFETASDDTATPLNVRLIGSHVGDCMGGCSLSETVGIDLNDATLRSRQQKGYTIKLSAHSGDAIILKLSPEQIQLQLAAIDKQLHMLGVTTPKSQNAPPVQTLGKVHLGVSFANISQLPPTIASALQHAKVRGVFIVRVAPDSVAEKAGIKPSDILTEYDGNPMTDTDELQAAVAATPPNKVVPIKVLRGERSLALQARFSGH